MCPGTLSCLVDSILSSVPVHTPSTLTAPLPVRYPEIGAVLCQPWSGQYYNTIQYSDVCHGQLGSAAPVPSLFQPMILVYPGLDQSMRGRLFSPRLNKLETTNGCVNTYRIVYGTILPDCTRTSIPLFISCVSCVTLLFHNPEMTTLQHVCYRTTLSSRSTLY